MILSEIDIDKKYFWKCEKGHNYTEKVLFLNDSCPVCETIRRNQRIQTISLDLLTMITEYLKVLLTKEIKVEHNISISQEYYYVLLELPEANIMIYLKDTNYFNPVFFEDKLSFFEHKMVLDGIKKQLVYCNKEHIFCDIDLKYEKREIKRITKIIKKCCIED